MVNKVMSQLEKNQLEVKEFSRLVHSVFKSNEQGAKLLEYWKDYMLMSSEDGEGVDLFSLGRSSGRKEFVRDIINQIKLAEA